MIVRLARSLAGSQGADTVLQYLYISSTLTLMAFSIGLTAMKYKEGLVVVGIGGSSIFLLSPWLIA